MNNSKTFHFRKSELTTIILLTCISFQILLIGSQPNMAAPSANQPLNEETLIDRLRGNNPTYLTKRNDLWYQIQSY